MPVAQGRLYRREALEERRGRLALEGRRPGKSEIAMEKGEEVGVPQLGPAGRVEGRQREEEVGHGAVLGGEERGEVGGGGAGVVKAGVSVHAAIISCASAPSGNAPGGP